IGIFDPFEYRSRTPEEFHRPSLLSEVTELTGGRAFSVENLNELLDIAGKIGTELRNQYVLGYRPSNKAHDARWRKIKIKLRAPKGLAPLIAGAAGGVGSIAVQLARRAGATVLAIAGPTNDA